MVAAAPAAPAAAPAARRTWADIARGAVATESAGALPILPIEATTVEDLACNVGKSEVNCPWNNLAKHMASALSSGGDSDEEAAEEALEEHGTFLKPAARGAKKCLCTGKVLIMFGHYGWVAASEQIDHPVACWNGGRVYVHRRDVLGGLTLVEGDSVVFYLYADEQGLGAEECRLQSWGKPRAVSKLSMNPEAAAFVPRLPNTGIAVPLTTPNSKLISLAGLE